jgi:hypothetical protein
VLGAVAAWLQTEVEPKEPWPTPQGCLEALGASKAGHVIVNERN